MGPGLDRDPERPTPVLVVPVAALVARAVVLAVVRAVLVAVLVEVRVDPVLQADRVLLVAPAVRAVRAVRAKSRRALAAF